MDRSENLLKNSCAQDGLDEWKIIQNGGNGFTTEKTPAGCKPINENTGIKENLACWATSSALCLKSQYVDLISAGLRPEELDNPKTRIEIQDWYVSRKDAGCKYQISITLLGEDKATQLDNWELDDALAAGSEWKQVHHTFENLPSGVRYVEFKHGGQDTKYWQGHYGAKFTNSGVFVHKPAKGGFGVNLLDNPRAEDGLSNWTILSSGGDGFDCEERPIGASPHEKMDEMSCWATSFDFCIKQQVVDLAAKGIDVNKLDKKRPKITVKDWYTPRNDCGCEYRITVRLLGEDREKELEKWERLVTRDEGAGWMEAKQKFKQYPAGVRYIEFTHGGKDTKCWSGYYGAKMTNAEIIVGTKKTNLLKNPTAADGMADWIVTQSGGDGWKFEETPIGIEPLGKASCWSTSYNLCEKVQMIDLVQSGYRCNLLDRKRPQITVMDWYGPRFDCGCKYNITVRLLGDDQATELDKFEFSDTMEAGAHWKEVRHVFKDYAKGVRFVEFKHGGQDTRGWAGNYGVKITKSGVYLENAPKQKQNKRSPAKNLLKNPCAKDGIQGWDVTSNGGDGFAVENEAVGSKQVKEFNKDAKGNSCWVTSYGSCEKRQVVDLAAEGFSPTFMDKEQPEIRISEWFGNRTDAGCIYWLKVRLLNSDKDEIDKREVNQEKDASGDWYHIKESFKNYGPGVRFVDYVHGGQDNCGWGGRYGVKITCSSVSLVDKNMSSSSSDDEY